MSEENARLVERLNQEFFNEGNFDNAGELLADDFVDHNPMPGSPSGPDGMKRTAEVVRSSFSDQESVDRDLIAAGDKVVDRWTMASTHTGDFFGMPPTGKRIEIHGIEIWRVADGRLAERWGIVDAMGVAAQVGGVPERAQASA